MDNDKEWREADKEWRNEVCECGHPRHRHDGIEGFCYVYGCHCKKFKVKG